MKVKVLVHDGKYGSFEGDWFTHYTRDEDGTWERDSSFSEGVDPNMWTAVDFEDLPDGLRDALDYWDTP